MNLTFSREIQYMLLVVGLFIVPRALQRFRLPSAITCVGIGAALGIAFHLFHEDHTVKLLATLGIVSMFLFAGLEVDFTELRRGRKVLLQHIAAQLGLLLVGAVVLHFALRLEMRPAVLFALALFTPSTGFILDSLDGLGLTPEERFWVKSKAIASEFVALGILVFTIQSADLGTLGLSGLALAAMVFLLPPIFRVFGRVIAPFAPKTEFTFLVIAALLCAFITRELGVYYLVGAFVVGLTAVRLRKDLPELSSEKLLGGVELFASFFIPFYFLRPASSARRAVHDTRVRHCRCLAGVRASDPRVRVALHRNLALDEPWRIGARIGTAVLPTLVFTIVIAEILEERFGLPPELFGALIVFTIVNTLVPGFVLRMPVPEFDTPEAPGPALRHSSPVLGNSPPFPARPRARSLGCGGHHRRLPAPPPGHGTRLPPGRDPGGPLRPVRSRGRRCGLGPGAGRAGGHSPDVLARARVQPGRAGAAGGHRRCGVSHRGRTGGHARLPGRLAAGVDGAGAALRRRHRGHLLHDDHRAHPRRATGALPAAMLLAQERAQGPPAGRAAGVEDVAPPVQPAESAHARTSRSRGAPTGASGGDCLAARQSTA